MAEMQSISANVRPSATNPQFGKGDNNFVNPWLSERLTRMRAGDRHAAAEFLHRYEGRIRRRISGKLNSPMRRLFDSEEIFSTVRRRLDQYVRQRQLAATVEGELWALIFRIADNALADKGRVFARLEAVEGSDSELARALLWRLREAERREPNGAAIELERAIELLPDPCDREILRMWLAGYRLNQIAPWTSEAPPNVRKKWERTRARLRAHLAAEPIP